MDIIVAVDQNWGIGYAGTQPVVLPEDRKRFRDLTTGCTVIVGRKTLADFPGGRPLKNRENIIMSTNAALKIEGAEVVSGTPGVFEAIEGRDPRKVFVIGGESVYRELLGHCLYAYVTKILAPFDADRFFPNLDEDKNWILESEGPILTQDGIGYRFLRYENLLLTD